MEDNRYDYWLHNIRGIGDKTAGKLVEKLGSGQAVYQASENSLKQFLTPKQLQALLKTKKEWRLEENYESLAKKGIKTVCIYDKAYPKRLKKIADPPFMLYYLGKLPEEKTLSLAMIGARECSGYGRAMAAAFAKQAALAGVNIISGMARGIDGIAQQAAMDAGGETFAVLGCGVDICYPASNRRLYDEMQKQGGVISPYLPGTMPVKTLFPYRNQIVAGLSDGVLVVEARQKSGTLITVDMALEQGKDVYAVPGRLTDRLSDGCNYLIRQGAGIALTPEDVIRELTIIKHRQGNEKKEEGAAQDSGNEDGTVKEAEGEEGILAFLDLNPLSVDEIYEKMKQAGMEVTFSEVLLELLRLCMTGKARQEAGNYYIRTLK